MKKRRKSNGVVVIVCIVLFLLLGIFIFLFTVNSGKIMTMAYAAEQQMKIPVIGTDRTQFYVGENEETTLYVYLSKEIEGGVIDILDEDRNIVTSIAVEDMESYNEEYFIKEVNITVCEEKDKVKRYTATYDGYESTPVNLYITPHITKEDVELCGYILEDLNEYLSENEIEEENLLETAREWLEEDDRVSETDMQSGSVLFSTIDSVMGIFSIQDNDTFGGYYEEDKYILDKYKNAGSTELGMYRYNIDTIVNSKVLVLRPLYGADKLCTVEYHADYGRKIAETLRDESDITCKDGEDCDKCRRCDVIDRAECYKYLGGLAIKSPDENDMTDYGVVLYNTHGSVIERKSGGMQGLYLMNKYYNIGQVLEYMENVAKLDYENENTEDAFTHFYDKFYGLCRESETYRLIYGMTYYMGFEDGYGIFHTSNLVMDYYSNKFFDNTIFYFGVCSVFQDEMFNQFLLNRGAQCIMGYPMKAGVLQEKEYFKKVFNHLLKNSKKASNRYKNIEEVINIDVGFVTRILSGWEWILTMGNAT